MVNRRFKKILCEIVKFKCELCHKIFDLSGLTIHRIRRKSRGGKYEHRNCMVLCNRCHKRLHENEFK